MSPRDQVQLQRHTWNFMKFKSSLQQLWAKFKCLTFWVTQVNFSDIDTVKISIFRIYLVSSFNKIAVSTEEKSSDLRWTWTVELSLCPTANVDIELSFSVHKIAPNTDIRESLKGVIKRNCFCNYSHFNRDIHNRMWEQRKSSNNPLQMRKENTLKPICGPQKSLKCLIRRLSRHSSNLSETQNKSNMCFHFKWTHFVHFRATFLVTRQKKHWGCEGAGKKMNMRMQSNLDITSYSLMTDLYFSAQKATFPISTV